MTAEWGTPDGSSQPSSQPSSQSSLQPLSLAKQERSVEFWWRAVRRKPLIAVLSLVGAVAPFGVVAVAPEHGFWHYVAICGWAFVAKKMVQSAKERLTRGLEVADEAAEADGARRPIDVRGAEVVLPSLDRGTPAHTALRSQSRLMGGLGVLALAGAVWVGVAVDDGLPMAALLAGLAALIATGFVMAPRGLRRRLVAVTSRPGPVLVRVVGHRPQERRWVLEPLDGEGEVGEVVLSGGGEHLVAGDVLHAWGDVLVDEDLPSRKRRLALTGPFGTLLALSVVDGRNIEVRTSREADARLAEKASSAQVVDGEGVAVQREERPGRDVPPGVRPAFVPRTEELDSGEPA